jgi:hypothetical protein
MQRHSADHFLLVKTGSICCTSTQCPSLRSSRASRAVMAGTTEMLARSGHFDRRELAGFGSGTGTGNGRRNEKRGVETGRGFSTGFSGCDDTFLFGVVLQPSKYPARGPLASSSAPNVPNQRAPRRGRTPSAILRDFFLSWAAGLPIGVEHVFQAHATLETRQAPQARAG